MSALISFGEPLIFLSAAGQNGRARLFAECSYCSQGARRQRAEAARLDAAIEANLKGLGYGG